LRAGRPTPRPRGDFAKLTQLPGGRVSGLLRVAGVLYDLASEPGRGEFLLTIREITPEELAAVLRGCGLESSAERLGEAAFAPGEPAAASASTALRETELGTEADALFVAQAGGSAEANARILSIVNAVNGIYEADLALTNRVVVQRAWSGRDPYSSSDSATLLGEFRSEFSAAVGTPYDDAQLFSGRDFESNVIGRAWVASSCGSYRYGVNQGLGLADSAIRVLVAHEEGHNLGADHSDSGIMAPTLDPDASWFSDPSRAQIAAYTATVSCLEAIASGAPPVLVPVGPQSVVEGGVLDLQLVASDPEGGPIVFGATPLLPGAQISADGRFVYAPPFTAAGCGGSKIVPVDLFASTGLAGATVEVFFGTKSAAVYSVSDTRLVVVVPSQHKKVLQVSVRVVRDGLASDNSLAFSIQGSTGGAKTRGKRAR
jgi:hypothetical protein